MGALESLDQQIREEKRKVEEEEQKRKKFAAERQTLEKSKLLTPFLCFSLVIIFHIRMRTKASLMHVLSSVAQIKHISGCL